MPLCRTSTRATYLLTRRARTPFRLRLREDSLSSKRDYLYTFVLFACLCGSGLEAHHNPVHWRELHGQSILQQTDQGVRVTLPQPGSHHHRARPGPSARADQARHRQSSRTWTSTPGMPKQKTPSPPALLRPWPRQQGAGRRWDGRLR